MSKSLLATACQSLRSRLRFRCLWTSWLGGAGERGWRFGQPFVIRHCRVGVLNDIGDLLEPDVVVLTDW